jgi:hypothetical protein
MNGAPSALALKFDHTAKAAPLNEYRHAEDRSVSCAASTKLSARYAAMARPNALAPTLLKGQQSQAFRTLSGQAVAPAIWRCSSAAIRATTGAQAPRAG